MSDDEKVSVSDAIIMRLHEEVGYCGHCGKKKCLGRKQHSMLPEKLPLNAVLAAILTGCGLGSAAQEEVRK